MKNNSNIAVGTAINIYYFLYEKDKAREELYVNNILRQFDEPISIQYFYHYIDFFEKVNLIEKVWINKRKYRIKIKERDFEKSVIFLLSLLNGKMQGMIKYSDLND